MIPGIARVAEVQAMSAIRAVFEDGIFRPIGPVDLPEGFEVTIDPGAGSLRQARPTDPEFAHLDPGLARIYATLSHRYDDGPSDGAARHDEHQP